MPTRTGPRHAARRNARHRRALTRAEVVSAAISFTERDELDRMSMRALATDLGVTAMALYAHVADKDELLDEIIDHVLEREATPLPASTEWRAWFGDAASRLHGMLTRTPRLLDRYCRHPVGVSAALRRMEVGLEVLRRAGFDGRQSIAAYATVHTYTLGFAALDIARRKRG